MTSLERLTLYRHQLSCAESFEEYRSVHIAWVEMLIDLERADKAKDDAAKRWVAQLEPKIEIEMKGDDST